MICCSLAALLVAAAAAWGATVRRVQAWRAAHRWAVAAGLAAILAGVGGSALAYGQGPGAAGPLASWAHSLCGAVS
jgi:hypothetical protein